ncbi:unnamed protein product [Ascophyllum nodosum]
MGDRGSHEQTHDLRDEVGGPSRLGMTVQDLKHMTAMRMGHPRTGGDGGGGGGAGRGSGGGGSNGGAIGDLKGSVLSSAGSPTPDVLSNSSRHRKGLLHLNKTGQEQQQLRTSAPVRESRQEQQRQQQQQHDLQPPPSIVLSRHSSAHAAVGGSPRYPHQRQQQQANGSRGQMARGSEIMPSLHQLPQRTMHRGVSAPRLYPSIPDDHISSGGGGGGGGGPGGQRPFGTGLSVEELKEMTKLRLQQQQGRSSPSFPGRSSSSGGGLGNNSLGNSNGGGGHERKEWRRSGSAGSAAMMEEHSRGNRDDGTSVPPAPFRRASSQQARGMLQGDHANATMHGRRVYGGSGRMEMALMLEDRMRTQPTEAGAGGISPRILSQPSSPCFSATSHSSSACTSPGGGRFHRDGRVGVGAGGGGRYGVGGGGGSAYAHAAHVPPPGFADNGPTAVDGGYQTVTLPLSGDGGERGFWPSRNDGGNLVHGFQNGDGPLHDVRGGSGGGGGGGGGSRRHMRSGSAGGNVAQLGSRALRQHHSFEDDGSSGSRFRGRNGVVGVGSSFQPATAVSVASRPLSMSASLSPPGMVGGSISDNLSDPGNGNGSLPGVRTGLLRKASYDDRKNPGWLDLQDAHGSGVDFDDHRAPGLIRSTSRLSDLRLNHTNYDYPPRPQSTGSVIGESSSTTMLSAVGSGTSSYPWVRFGATASASAPLSATEDATAMMCAEFALLTPKSALQQQQQQQRIGDSPMQMWPPSWGTVHDAGGSATTNAASLSDPAADLGGLLGTEVGHHVRRGRGANDGNVGSGRAVGGSQGSRGGSEVSSPEGPHASKGGKDLDERSTGSGGSGGGGQQGGVHAAFGALDAAAGHGGGGGREANVGRGGFDGSFPDSADGDGDAGRNGVTEAQSYARSLLKPTCFFGEDLPDCEGMGLEDDSSLSRGVGQGSQSGSASAAPDAGRKVTSAGPAEGTALGVAMDNQLSF